MSTTGTRSLDAETALRVAEHIGRFNDGARARDFDAFAAAFAEDARLEFEGAPIPPVDGRDAIIAAYRFQPPDDTITVVDDRLDGDQVIVGYAWDRDPATRAGEMRMRFAGDELSELIVTFQPSPLGSA